MTGFDDEKIRSVAIRLNVARYVRNGWKVEDGFLHKGHVKTPIQSLTCLAVLMRHPGDPLYNPKVDPPAVRWRGGQFVSPGRYYLPSQGLYCDANGGLMPGPEEECFECGGAPWHVRTKQGLPPNSNAWEFNFTYCRRCVSATEVEERRQRMAGAALAKAPKWRKA